MKIVKEEKINYVVTEKVVFSEYSSGNVRVEIQTFHSTLKHMTGKFTITYDLPDELEKGEVALKDYILKKAFFL